MPGTPDQGAPFEYGEGFAAAPAEASRVQLGKFEAVYEELFAEVIDDGVITSEERQQLDKAADSLGLDRSQLRRLEVALQAAYEARHKVRVREEAEAAAAAAAAAAGATQTAERAELAPLEPATDQRTLALERRIRALEARIAELEEELEEARAVAVDVDLSDMAPTAGGALSGEDLVDLERRVRHDPRDVDSLRALFHAYGHAGDSDRRWATAHVLVYLGAANEEEQAAYAERAKGGMIKPKAPLGRDAWRRLLAHPELEPLVGEIFSVVAPSVLLGRISAMRRDKSLPKLDARWKQDPQGSPVYAVRCLVWAGAILGVAAPPIFVNQDWPGEIEMMPGVPPQVLVGSKALSGRPAGQLAFLAGRHLALHREELFLRLLLASVAALEDVFLAALSIGNPGLPLSAQAKGRVMPIAGAIEPMLDPAAVDKLRGHFLRFVEEGGRTNLQRWADAADRTAARAGLLLCNDLRAAHAVIAAEDPLHLENRMDDLLEFVTSERFEKLRKQLGISAE